MFFIFTASLIGLILGIILCDDSRIMNGLMLMLCFAGSAFIVSVIVTTGAEDSNIQKVYELKNTYTLSQMFEENADVCYAVENNNEIYYNVCNNNIGKSNIFHHAKTDCEFIVSDELILEKYKIYPENKILRFFVLIGQDYYRFYIPEGAIRTFKK